MANWWDKYDAQQEPAAEAPWWQKYERPEIRDRTIGEVAGDLGVGLASGSANLVGSLAQTGLSVAGGVLESADWLATKAGMDDPNMRAYAASTQAGLTDAMSEANEGFRLMKSEPTRQRDERFAEDMKAQDGALDKIIFGAETIATDPAMLTNMLAEQIPQMAGLLSLSRRVGKKAYDEALALTGSREAAEEAAQQAAVRANVAVTGAQGAGFSAADAAQAVMEMPDEKITQAPAYRQLIESGMTPEQARAALARDAANVAAVISGPISAGTGMLTAGLESRIARGALDRGPIMTGALGAIGRGSAEEVIEEGGEGVASNVGLQRTVDPERSLMDGVPERLGPAAVLGGLMEGGMYLGGRGVQRLQDGPRNPIEAGAKLAEDALRDAGVPLDDVGAPSTQTAASGGTSEDRNFGNPEIDPSQPPPALQPRQRQPAEPSPQPEGDPDAELDARLAPLEPTVTNTPEDARGQPPIAPAVADPSVASVGTGGPAVPAAGLDASTVGDAAPAVASRAIDPDERSRADFEQRLAAAAEGLPAEQVERLRALYRAPARDRVTGLYRGEEMRDTLEVAWNDSDTTPAVYVEMDMANLGGLNAAKGNSGADPYLTRAGEIAREELAQVGATVAMRKGGDEFGYVVQGADQATVDAAMERAQQRFAAEVAAEGLDTLPNPKPGRGPGVGMVFGSAPLVRDVPIADAVAEADTLVEARKKEGSHGNRAGEAAGDSRTTPAAADGNPAVQAGAIRAAAEGSRSEAGDPAAAEAEGLTEQQALEWVEREIGWDAKGGRLLRGPERQNDGFLAEVTGRTNWQPKPGPDGRPSAFWRLRPDESLNEEGAKRALRKHREGKKLGTREQRFVDYALATARDYVEADAVDREVGRQEAIRALRDAGANFDPTDAREALSIAELVDRAYALGADPVEVLDATFDGPGAKQAKALRALIKNKEASRGLDQRAVGFGNQSRPETVPRGQGASSSSTATERPPAEPAARQPAAKQAEGLTLAAPPVESSAAPAAAQGGLFAPPTQAERLDAARREKDADRNGLTGTGRTDMMAGAGELFAGPRPQQTDIEDAARSRRQEVPFDQRNLARLPAVPTDRTRALGAKLGRGRNGPTIGEVSRRDLPRDLVSAIEAFEQATDTEIVVTKGMPADGATTRDGTLFVDVETSVPLLTTAAHEWLHQLRRDNPTLFNMLRDEVRRQGRLAEWKAELQRRMTRDGEDASTLTDDLSSEELTADAMADAVTDPVFLREFAARKPTVFRRVVDTFLKYLDRVISRFPNTGSSEYLTDVQAFRDVLADVLEKFQADATAEARANGVDAAFSRSSEAARLTAEPTGKISPITRKPIYRVLDGNGQLLQSIHTADTAAEAVETAQRVLENQSREPAPAMRIDAPPSEKEPRSNWKIYRGEIDSTEGDDGFLYHVTSYANARKIIRDGLVPGNASMFGGAYAAYSRGRVFLTERSGVNFWRERVEQQLFHESDNPAAVAVVRIPRDKVTAPLQPDTVGSDDARAPAYYVDDQPIFSRRQSDQTQTPEFRRWFGDSKVVDADGSPLVVYHGTPDGRFLSEDAVFKSERDRYGFGRKDGAHWFASDARAANTYADARRAFDYQAAEPAVQAAYLKMTNPLVIDAGGAKWRDAQRRGKTGDVIAEAKANGNDGVIIRNVRDDYQTGPVKGDKPTTTYVVFDSAQIKSVENIGTFGQRPVTEAEASRVGMTVDEANEAQGRGSILFSRRRDDQTQTPENPSIRRSRGQGAYIAAQAAARATGAAFRNLNLRLRNSIRDAEEMRRLAADARQLIGVVATAPDYAQELKDLATDITPEKRRILSGDPGPTGDSLRSALAEYDRIRDDMKAVDAARKRVNQQQAEANRMLDRLDRMEADMPMADREQIIAMLDPIVESAQQAYERAKRIRDFRRSKQWALIKAQEKRTETLNRLAAEGYQQGAMTWAADGSRWKGVRGFLNTARERFQDRFLALRETQRDIEESVGQVLADAVNVYRMENLMHGRAADRIDQFQKALIQPLREFMKLNKLEQKDVETYLYARHAKERNARIAQINPNMPDGGSGMSNAEADRILADYQSAGLTPKLEAAARKADAVRRFTLQTLLDSGQITQELHDQLANVYQHYVPLRGKVEDGDDVRPSRGAGKGLDVRGNPVQRAMGRGDENLAENILAEMVGDAERAILQAEKARVGRGLLRLALQFPNPEVWKVEPVEMEYKFSETTGEVYLGIKNDIADPETVVVKHKGKPYRVRLEDPRLRNAVKNLGVENYEGFVKYVGWMNRYLSAMLTRFNPGFVPVNMIRDLIQGTIGIAAEQGFGAAARALRHWPGALRGLWQDANGTQGGVYQQYAREFAEAGGKTGYMVFQNVEDLQSRIDGDIRGAMALLKQGKPVAAVAAGMRNSTTFQFIEQVNDTIENGMRLSAYIEQRRSGASKEQAAEYAKALTVNFNRKGQLSSLIKGLWIFYNAAMQGSYRIAKLLGNRKTQIILGGMMATQTMLAAIGMGMREDEDELSAWDRIPEHVKERSLVIPLSTEGAYASIPMPYGFNFFTWMAGYLPNIADRGWRDRNSLGDMVSATGRAMLNAFSPVPIDEGGVGLFPTPTRPFVDIGMNESGLGFRLRNDNPYSAFERPRAYQGRGDTPEVFKMLARGLNGLAGGDEFTPPKTMRWLTDRAPEDLEYLFDFVGGGPTRIVSQTMTGVEKLIAGSPTSLGDVPILRALGGKVPGRSQEAPVYYDHRDDIERTAAMVRDRYKQAASEALRASDAAPESVIGAYIGGGHSAAKAEAERLGLDSDVAAELRAISRQAGEAAAMQVIGERGMLADGMALKRSKAGDITESSGGTPQLEPIAGTLFDAYKTATKELDAIADQRRAIESDPNIGAIERRRRLDEIAERQSAAMRQVNRTWASVSRTYATGTRQ